MDPGRGDGGPVTFRLLLTTYTSYGALLIPVGFTDNDENAEDHWAN